MAIFAFPPEVGFKFRKVGITVPALAAVLLLRAVRVSSFILFPESLRTDRVEVRERGWFQVRFLAHGSSSDRVRRFRKGRGCVHWLAAAGSSADSVRHSPWFPVF